MRAVQQPSTCTESPVPRLHHPPSSQILRGNLLQLQVRSDTRCAILYRENTWLVCKSTFLHSVIPLCPQKANIPWIFIEERVFFCSAPVPVSAVPQGDGSTGGEELREGQVEQGMPPCLRINGTEEQCDAGMASLRVTVGLFPASAPICGFPCPTEDVLGALDLWVPARHQMGLSFDDNPSAAPWRRAI